MTFFNPLLFIKIKNLIVKSYRNKKLFCMFYVFFNINILRLDEYYELLKSKNNIKEDNPFIKRLSCN